LLYNIITTNFDSFSFDEEIETWFKSWTRDNYFWTKCCIGIKRKRNNEKTQLEWRKRERESLKERKEFT
jgi:hypothetical protein